MTPANDPATAAALRACEAAILRGVPDAVRERAARVRLAVFDVDGTLTDGRLRIGDGGGEYKRFHARDGLGLKRAMAHGIIVAIISARSSAAVTLRARELGIEHVHQGRGDKRACLAALLQALAIPAAECAFTGDDLTDLPALRDAGLAVAVADAHPALDAWVDWRTPAAGGAGAARQVCDLLLAARGAYGAELAHWL